MNKQLNPDVVAKMKDLEKSLEAKPEQKSMKEIVKDLNAEVVEAMRQIAAKHGFSVLPQTMRFDSTTARVTIEFTKPLSEEDRPTCSEESLHIGLASKGTRVSLMHNRERVPATIVKTSRTKYVVRLDCGFLGSIPFRGCKIS